MSLATDQAELAAVQAAILAITTGGVAAKEGHGGDGAGHAITNLPLPQLYARETALLQRIQRATSGSFSIARFNNLR